jgi:hypothetical protein
MNSFKSYKKAKVARFVNIKYIYGTYNTRHASIFYYFFRIVKWKMKIQPGLEN